MRVELRPADELLKIARRMSNKIELIKGRSNVKVYVSINIG